GFDTTTFMIFHKNKLTHIRWWLGVVVLMPIAGGLASLTFTLSEKALAVYLGFFAGLILYISASNLLPQAHAKDSSNGKLALTVLGVIFMFIVTRFV
ncbi:MAG TPA: permease, partial [Verrucomicrobiae bacterium]|nr:permease [Verrucomicrobiae bacterium]